MRDVSPLEDRYLDPIAAIVAAPPPSMLPRVIRMAGRRLADVGGSLMLEDGVGEVQYSPTYNKRTRVG